MKKVLIVEDQFVEANDIQLMLVKAGYEVCGIARSVDIAEAMIKKENPGLVLLDIFLKGKRTGIDLAKQLREENIAFIFLSANSNEEVLAAAKTTEPYGFIVKPFREKDLLVTLEIAQYRHEHSRESRYRRETALIQQLEKMVINKNTWKENLLQTGKMIQQEIPFDYLAVGFDDTTKLTDHAISFLRIGFNEYQTIGIKELETIAGTTMHKEAISLDSLFRKTFQLQSLLSFPLLRENGETCSCRFYSRRPDVYNSDHNALLYRLQPTFTRIIEQIPVEKARVHTPPSVHAHTSTDPISFEGIVGNSHLLLNVFDQITQVAPFDTAVLILGESGTGKERIAESIHHHSPRKGKALVKVNCATLPATSIESELFGHESAGKFEQANGGTIFLDEIGELPLDLQLRFLRVLQEKEIEPTGNPSTIKIDVRVIATTNRNLEKEVAEGRFRLDLYYRLNVFPIVLPSLRERMEDIPALTQHFISMYNRKSGKRITGLSDKVLKNMMAYSWPGNIRELEHIIESSVLLSKGAVIEDVALPRQAE